VFEKLPLQSPPYGSGLEVLVSLRSGVLGVNPTKLTGTHLLDGLQQSWAPRLPSQKLSAGYKTSGTCQKMPKTEA